MKGLDDRIACILASLRQAGRLRALKAVESLPQGRVRKDGRVLVNVSSNDYLGLSRHPLLVERAGEWAREFGAGSGASRLVTGHLAAVETVEAKIARAKGTEAALVLVSGWQANASLLPALLDTALWGGAPPRALADRLIHASLVAGLTLSGGRFRRFRHNDLGHLSQLLGEGGCPALVVAESVYSMDGDLADIPALAALCREKGAALYVDEAHATGIFGEDGFGLAKGGDADVVMGTFSKGLGGFGAYVACSAVMRDYLVNRASGLIYATALPPAVLGAMDAALDLVPTLGAERARLAAMSERLRGAVRGLGLDCGASASPIVPVILGSEARALGVAAGLERRGYLGMAIRPPTVPEGTSRLRLTLSAAHSDSDLDGLISALSEAVEEIP